MHKAMSGLRGIVIALKRSYLLREIGAIAQASAYRCMILCLAQAGSVTPSAIFEDSVDRLTVLLG
jgi:hypothetical protein